MVFSGQRSRKQMKLWTAIYSAVGAFVLGGSLQTHAATSQADALVTLIEVTYLPDSIKFQVDQTVANCAPGSWIVWEGGALYPRGAATTDETERNANVRIIGQVLLGQKALGSKVRLFANNKNASGNCVVDYLYAL